MFPQGLDVLDELPGGVVPEVRLKRARMGSTLPTASLIELNHSVDLWIEQPALTARASRAGATVQHDCRLPFGVAGSLPVDAVAIAHWQQALRVRFDCRE